MTLGFMGLLAAAISERVSIDAGVKLLAPLLFLGLFSVVLWHASEVMGQGDLRLYLGVQFGSLLVVLMLIMLFRSRYTHSGLMTLALVIYAAAKLLESYDRQVFRALGFISGHSLKHLVAAVAVIAILIMLLRRTVSISREYVVADPR
jgi:hypothetical protein